MSSQRFRRTSGGLYSPGLHRMWCLKYRRRVLGGRVALRLDELIEQIAAEHGWQIVVHEVMPDHVHLFVRVGYVSETTVRRYIEHKWDAVSTS